MILCEQYIPLKVEHYQPRGPLTEYSSYNSTFNIPNSTVLQCTYMKYYSELNEHLNTFLNLDFRVSKSESESAIDTLVAVSRRRRSAPPLLPAPVGLYISDFLELTC